MHGDILGDVGADAELEPRLPCAQPRAVGPITMIRASGSASPQRERFGDRRDAERRRARAERGLRAVERAVPVPVRLDDRPQLGAVERREQRRARCGAARPGRS